jgi:hypothetical protein
MVRTKTTLAACGAMAMLLATAGAGRALESDADINYLTFSGPVALPGVELQAGTYIFERATPSDLSMIRVTSRDTKTVFLTALTHMVTRPGNLPRGQVVSLGESPRGVAPPIKVWYPLNRSLGHEFIYTR